MSCHIKSVYRAYPTHMPIELPLRTKQQDIEILSASNLVMMAFPSIQGFAVASGKLKKSFFSHRAFHFLLELMCMYIT